MGGISDAAKKVEALIREEIRLRLEDSGSQDAEMVDRLTEKMMVAVAEKMGGVRFTFPRADALATRRKHTCISVEFNGANVRQLAFTFGYCRANIYNILRRKDEKCPL